MERDGWCVPRSVPTPKMRLGAHLQSYAGFARRIDASEIELPDAVHESRVDVVGLIEVFTPHRLFERRSGNQKNGQELAPLAG